MTTTATEPDASTPEATSAADAPEAAGTTTTTAEAATDPTEALGDAGKQALDRMKAERKAARDEAAAFKQQLADLQAKIDGTEAEHKAEQERQRVKDEALSAANQRILKAEVRAAAASKLADPQDALRFIDLSEFEVGSDGEVDADAITQAIADLIEKKPYLAAQGGKRFEGGADGGTRKESKPSQLTEADVKKLYAEGRHEEINAAREAGRLDKLLGRKT